MTMQTTVSANKTIYDSIRKIAQHKIINPYTKSFNNAGKILGYVKEIHTEGDLCGTIDVQEYNNPVNRQEVSEGVESGLHRGVYLSAIQNNENGMVVIPFLYSDVVIEVDPVSLKEYVVQYSHADTVKIDAHNEIVIGVTETKEFELDEDSPDYDELEKTGLRSNTKYSPTSILNVVAKSDDEKEQSKVEITADSVLSKHDKAQILLDSKQILAKYNAREIIIREDGVYLGKGDATEPAVLGDQLAALLDEWLGLMASMVTSTALGPQPPVNLAQFISLQTKVKAYRSSISGFLSKTVKIAE